MTIPTIPSTSTKTAYEPTPNQLAREASRKRFNWIFVYIPTAVLGLIVLGMTIFMIWAALTSSPEDRIFSQLSGIADIILISCVILPAMLMCAIGPALAGLLIYRTTERRKLPPEERRSKLQNFLWRIDNLIEKIQVALRDSYLDKATRPLIKGHASVAALKALVNSIRNPLYTLSEKIFNFPKS